MPSCWTRSPGRRTSTPRPMTSFSRRWTRSTRRDRVASLRGGRRSRRRIREGPHLTVGPLFASRSLGDDDAGEVKDRVVVFVFDALTLDDVGELPHVVAAGHVDLFQYAIEVDDERGIAANGTTNGEIGHARLE